MSGGAPRGGPIFDIRPQDGLFLVFREDACVLWRESVHELLLKGWMRLCRSGWRHVESNGLRFQAWHVMTFISERRSVAAFGCLVV